MRSPTILVSLGSGQEAWLSVGLDSLLFKLETENGKTTTEVLTLTELKRRFPGISGLVAEVVAEAIRARPKPVE